MVLSIVWSLIHGTPLNADQRQQDDARVDRYLHDPNQQLKSKRAHDEDEQKLEKLMRVMQDAFLYDYDGVAGSLVRVKFRPNSNYNPSTTKRAWRTAWLGRS